MCVTGRAVPLLRAAKGRMPRRNGAGGQGGSGDTITPCL